MADLFDTLDPGADGPRPLADRLRPTALSQVVGQDHVLGVDGPLGAKLTSGQIGSGILWGPPGVGKTTIARLLATETDLEFVQISAIFSGVPELRKVFEAAKLRRRQGRGTLLFVDEIHRFNKAQQDGFLPHMEDGTIVLVGATTENPSFELNSAVLSRAQVIVLNRLDLSAMERLMQRGETDLGTSLPLQSTAREAMQEMADGDGRALLNMVEQVVGWGVAEPLDRDALVQRLNRRAAQYDKSGDAHYNLISALHKSVRGADPDAALYWFARMLEGGEDPRYLARRITRMAVEDVGLADPSAQDICLRSWETYERRGSPVGELALAQALVYLALAPKSNALYKAYNASKQFVKDTPSLPPPRHILPGPTAWMRAEGFGVGYEYDHDLADALSGQDYFPEGGERQRFYEPTDRGEEEAMARRLQKADQARMDRRIAGFHKRDGYNAED